METNKQGNGRVYQRPDITIRNQMRSALGRMPTKEEVRAQMGLPVDEKVPAILTDQESREPDKPKKQPRSAGGATKQLKYVPYEQLSKDYIEIKTAGQIMGKHPSTIYLHVLRGKLLGVVTKIGNARRVMVKQSDLLKNEEPRRPVAAARERELKVERRTAARELGLKVERTRTKRAYQKRPKQAVVAAAPAIDHSLQNHISYAYGHCMAWIEHYATGADLSARVLAPAIGELLKRGGK